VPAGDDTTAAHAGTEIRIRSEEDVMKFTSVLTGYRRIALATVVVLAFVPALPAGAAQTHTITTAVDGGNGRIKPGSAAVKQGKRKTVTAKPAKGWHVARLTLDGTTVVYDKDDSVAVSTVDVRGKAVKYTLKNVDADHAVGVTFEENRTFGLDVSVDGGGSVKLPGMKCRTDSPSCVVTLTEDRIAKLKAKPAKGYLFAGWSGSASGIKKQNKLRMNGDKTVSARFELKSTPAAAFKVAEKISVVDAKNGGSGLIQPLRFGVPADVPADSDYETDETFTFVEEHSVEAFKTINEILCMAAQTKYESFLNVGPYKALVDSAQCESDKDDASSADGEGSQSSGASQPDYMEWTVVSRRKDNASPHIVEVWVHEEEEGEYEPPMLIFAKMTITESASAANPYGIFVMNFEAHPLGAATGDFARVGTEQFDGEPMFKGYMKTERDASGDVLLKFISKDGGESDEQFQERATLNRHATGGRGTTSVHFEFDGHVEDATFNIAFTDDYFLRDEGGTQTCLDRNDFDETAWRYGLYDATTGERVSPRSGFPVKVIQDGKTYYGWIGYWGMWFPEEVTLGNGDTVYRTEFGGGEENATPLQVFVAQGKLRKHTRRLLTLADVKNVPMDWWNEDQNYRLSWDGASFQKLATFNRENGTWQDLEPNETLSLADLSYDTLFLWSQALGGNVRVKLTCTETPPQEGEWQPSFSCSASDASTVVLYEESVIFPSDPVPSTLACMMQCPNGANDSSPNLYQDDSGIQYQEVPPASASYLSYTFDSETMLLMNGATPIVQTVQNEVHPWGLHSGPLFEPTPGNLADLACNWNEAGTSTCGWQAWDALDEYYTWESGPNDWNTLTAVRNGEGQLERFEPPLSVQYTHQQTDPEAPDYKYNGTTFYLEYSGFGNLHGIPGSCVERGTGTPTSCGPNTRWIPEFTIPDGAEISGGEDEYLCKALEKEQRMRHVDLSTCSDLHLVTYELPRINEWRSPDIGKEPKVDGAPAVVGGVIQN
jgi:hypothetical protein